MRKTLLWLVLMTFGLFSTYAMWQVGYFGIWEAGFASVGALQILLDLTIACCLVASWMIADARARGVVIWPWLLAVLAIGSIALLAYLLVREYRKETQSQTAQQFA